MGARSLRLRFVTALCATLVGAAVLAASAWAAPVEFEGVVGVGYSTATLEAAINPEGVETTYRFEYGTSASYGTSVPVPDGVLPASSAGLKVSQALTSLKPGTQYHYRVVATSGGVATNGEDQTFATFAAVPAQADTCPNAVIRASGLSENLPDCRAYEMVSPVDKNGTSIIGQNDTNIASLSGNAIAYASRGGFGDTTGSGDAGVNQFVAFRGPAGWQTHGIDPIPLQQVTQIYIGGIWVGLFSGELDRGALASWSLPGATGSVPNGENLYLENTGLGVPRQLETVSEPQGGAKVTFPLAVSGSAFVGASGDLGVVVFGSGFDFLPGLEATGFNGKLYAMDHGTLELVGILPDGTVPASGARRPRSTAYFGEALMYNDAVSRDGSRILFLATPNGGSQQQLYMRKHASETAWVSQSEASAPNPEPNNVKFQAASPDGMKVLFSTTDSLLDADPGGSGYGLYLYTDSAHPETDSNLMFIGRTGGEPTVIGMSTDAKQIYFAANETSNSEGTTLYGWDEGTIRTITERFQHLPVGSTLKYGIPYKGQENVENLESLQAWVSSDGQRIAFIGATGGKGRPVLAGRGTPGLHNEMYVYDASSQTLKCVSCPSGGAAVRFDVEPDPQATTFAVNLGFEFARRFISADGRYVFFNTREALVPRDTNGLTDAYEYNLETGEVALLSSGTGDYGSWFVNASESGNDVFFVSQNSYSRLDKDNLVDLYDARVDGGLPEPPPTPVPCAGDACQGVPSAVPSFNTASGFSGLGNIPPEAPSTSKRSNKLKKHHLKKRKRKGHAGKRAKHSRSGSRGSRRAGR